MNSISMRATFLWLFGPIIWAAHFFVLYAGTTIVCGGASASQHMQIRGLALALTALALAALLGFIGSQLLASGERGQPGTEVTAFLKQTAIVLAGLSVIAILWSAASAILIPTCASAAG